MSLTAVKLTSAQRCFLLNHKFATQKSGKQFYGAGRLATCRALERQGILEVIYEDDGENEYFIRLTPLGTDVVADLVKDFYA